MKRYLYIILAATMLCGCEKADIAVSDDDIITFNIGAADATKALLDYSSLCTEGTSLALYDIVTGATKTSVNGNYINGDLLTCSSTAASNRSPWKVKNGQAGKGYYLWPASGKQKFFCYLVEDAKSNLKTATVLNPTLSDSTLTIPAKELTTASDQLDFLYSSVDYRDDASDHSTVALTMHHLFSACAFNISNTSSNPVTVKSLKVVNLRNSNSAKIEFKSTGTVVTYGTGTKTVTDWASIASNITVSKGTVSNDVFGTPSATADNHYYLMWPQVKGDLLTATTETKPAGTEIHIEITYNNGGSDITRYLALPQQDWQAGMRYLFTITFADKMLSLATTVSPWEDRDEIVNYSDGTVQAQTVAEYEVGGVTKSFKLYYDYDRGYNGTGKGQSVVDDVNRTVRVRRGLPVKVKFNLQTPEGAEWLVSLSGDRYAFTVEKLTDNTVDGTDCCFQLVPSTDGEYASPSRDYKVTIKIALRLPSGRIVSADEILQGTDYSDAYTIILPRA